MPTHIVQPLTVSTPQGNKEWYAVVRTSDGVELCRCAQSDMANAICAIFIEKGAP